MKLVTDSHMSGFKAEGKIIAFVSHAVRIVKALCQTTLLLAKGRIVTICSSGRALNNCPAIQILMELSEGD